MTAHRLHQMKIRRHYMLPIFPQFLLPITIWTTAHSMNPYRQISMHFFLFPFHPNLSLLLTYSLSFKTFQSSGF
uniref:Uncharacterized protein n=1 Tax=Panstrongylus lignarius TaxID=156445 RepID=A0A224XTR8_9HEMI